MATLPHRDHPACYMRRTKPVSGYNSAPVKPGVLAEQPPSIADTVTRQGQVDASDVRARVQ